MPRCRGVATVVIHLTDIVRDRSKLVGICNSSKYGGGPAPDSLVVSIGNGHEFTRVAVCSGSKQQSFFAEANAPRIVVRVSQELKISDRNFSFVLFDFEAIETRTK